MNDSATLTRESFILLSAAIAVSALLQVFVFEAALLDKEIALGLTVGGYGVVAWIYLGGYVRAVNWHQERVLRRHIRQHPQIVEALRTVAQQTNEVFGGKEGYGLGQAMGDLLNAVYQKQQSARSLNSPDPFTPSEQQQHRVCEEARVGWSMVVGMWPTIYNRVWSELGPSGPAALDSYAFLFAADLVGSFLQSSLQTVDHFALGAQQGGFSKLDLITLSRWEGWAKSANALIDRANEIGRRSPSETGVQVNLSLRHVPEHLGRPLAEAASGPPPTATQA